MKNFGTYVEFEEGEKVDWSKVPVFDLTKSIFNVVNKLSEIFSSSKGEIKRKIREGALWINGQRIDSLNFTFGMNKEYQIKLGREFRRIKYV